MEARKTKRRRRNGRLLKVLAAVERAREIEDPIRTDRDGELLPDPAEEPTDETLSEMKSARRAKH